MLPIKHTLLIVFEITSLVVFFIGLLTFMTYENYTVNIEEVTQTNLDLETANRLIVIDTSITRNIENFIITNDYTWQENYYATSAAFDIILEESIWQSTQEPIQNNFASIFEINQNIRLLEDEIFEFELNNDFESLQSIPVYQKYISQKSLLDEHLRINLLHQSNSAYLINFDVHEDILEAKNNAFVILVLSGIISGFLMIIALLISRTISKPIEQLQKLMKIFSNENKIGKINQNIEIQEISDLHHNFITMAKTVNQTINLEKKLNKELLSIDLQKDEFVSMISHELRTPLALIRGYTELLQKPNLMGKLNNQQKEALSEIYIGSQRLERLIGDIMTVEKLELGKLLFDNQDIDVNEFIQEQIKVIQTLSYDKEFNISSIVDTSSKIHADKDRLCQVISNLVDNAIGFLPKSGGKIEIGVYEEDNYVVFYVKDNGKGIPKNKQDHLFKKFYQVDTSPTRNHKGSGLGLCICKGIVEGLRGKIWVESQVNKGTTFFLKIPQKGNTRKHSI